MAVKIVIIFDFDRTLINDDSDRWVIAHMGLTQLFNQLRLTLPWTSLMDRMVEEIHSQGKTVEDIAECLKHVPLHPQTVSAIKSAHALGCDLKVVSDANQYYIATILKHHGLYDCFSDIISNPTAIDGEGFVMKHIQASIPEKVYARFIYLGDGRGDYCPTLKLDSGDHIMPRKEFPLWECIFNNPGLIKAEVHEWSNGEELEMILLQLIDKISKENNVKSSVAVD